jgi:glyoxylase-like metal-dependent hydrolase (beta-lactamase superfamily II)/ferredoxin
MAKWSARLAGNAPGALFVDDSCIDCDTCRQLAPETFAEQRGQSIVARQPEGGAARRRALMALVACPTASIGLSGGAAAEVREAARAFPQRIDGEIYYCGYTSRDSYGASSYLVRRPGGNVLVDSPRATGALLDGIDALGGVALHVLTHRDDVADHEALHRRFGCARVMHRADLDARTRGIERPLDGDSAIALADDLTIIPVPGHTRGSIALLHGETLFSGDHLWADEAGHLEAGRSVCWYSWRAQTESMRKLLAHSFRTVLPGHGRRYYATNSAICRRELVRLSEQMAK